MKSEAFFSICLLSLVFVLSSCSEGPCNGPEPKALIVCAGLDYGNSAVSTLPGTVSDATEVCACLESIYAAKGVEYESVLMICEGENPDTRGALYPSADNIRKILGALRPQSSDLVFFYWSGHGHKDSRGMFLAAAAGDGADYTKLYASELLEWARNLNCSVVIVLDSCYSGNAVQNGGADFIQSLRTLTEEVYEPDVCILAACASDSLSYVTSVPSEDGPARAHSVFTASLLRVMGWQCSVNRTTQVHGRNAEGYLRTLPSRTDTAALTELVLRDMRINRETEKQVPETAGTAFPVFLIP